MALDPLSIASGIIDLLRIALILAVPLFLASIPVFFFKNRVSKKFSLNWIQSAVLTTYVAVTIILIFLYLWPYCLGFAESIVAHQTPPSMLAMTPADLALAVIFTILKILSSALVLTILLLPLEFFAEFVSDRLKEKKLPAPAKTFIGAYCTSLLVTIIILFVFPWIANGVIYLIYWG
ncbi:MAG: hypothetical protein PHH08_05150 [Candidatus ainarchaeum sp.]|nr:hypothetical protein [Candidatus ainarchaeum sp.]